MGLEWNLGEYLCKGQAVENKSKAKNRGRKNSRKGEVRLGEGGMAGSETAEFKWQSSDARKVGCFGSQFMNITF